MPLSARVLELTQAELQADLTHLRREHVERLHQIYDNSARQRPTDQSDVLGRAVVSEIGRTYRERADAIQAAIRRSLRFQDGEPFTADDLTTAFTNLFEAERREVLEQSRARLAEMASAGSLISETVTDANRLVQQFRARAEHLVLDHVNGPRTRSPQRMIETTEESAASTVLPRSPSSASARVMALLQLYEAAAVSTSALSTVSHAELIALFSNFMFHHSAALGIKGWSDSLQSLRDGGVDSVWRFTEGRTLGKLGFQIKSHGDFTRDRDESFRRGVLAQIAESRQMGLTALFIAMAADLTNPSHEQKARGLSADIAKMTDGYVHTISPEKVSGIWQWSRRQNVGALDQMREAGYAWLTVVYDSLGNRNQNSWGKDQGGGWSHAKRTTLRVGETVHLSAIAVSPSDDPPEFQFEIQPSGRSFQLRQDWSCTPDWTWQVAPADIGRDVCVKIATRCRKAYYQFRDADDYTYATYDILPASSSKAVR